jgi:hypothetical protein
VKRGEGVACENCNSFERISMNIFGPFDLDKYKHELPNTKGYYLTITDI